MDVSNCSITSTINPGNSAGVCLHMMVIDRLAAYGRVSINGNHIKVAIPTLCRDDRLRALDAIFKNFESDGAVRLNDRPDYSSIGYIKVFNFKICVKSIRQQQLLAPGVPNEQFLTQKINKYLLARGCINLIFYNSERQVEYRDVVRCYATENRKRRKGRNKADMVIETEKSEYCVSIKQSDAERWESADTAYGAVARQKLQQALDTGKTQLVHACDTNGNAIYRSGDASKPVMRLATELYWHMDAQQQKTIIFGDDVVNGGAVVVNTFDDNHFAYDDSTNTLRIACDRVYTPDAPVRSEDQPYWMIRNDITRNCKKLGILGLRIESVFESRIKYGVEV